MKINPTVHSAVRYIRNHLVRFLLLAVILTTGLTLRMAAFAKYSSYLNDYTSTVAGDFFFTSDYLFAPEDRSGSADYRINSWKGEEYGIPIEIRNYENSLRFNHTGTDFFYWVEAEVYTDEACTIRDTRFQTASVTYESIGATDSSGKQYGFMPGMEEFDHTKGMQEVKVKITPTTTISSGHCYMKVTAHTVPLTQVSGLTLAGGVSTDTSRGVYSAAQEAVFFLNITSTTASIATNLYAGTGSDYTVRYTVICNSSEGTGGSVRAKVYYNSARLIPDVSLGNSYAENSGDYAYSAEQPWRYVQTTINVGGSEDLYFYKTSLSLTPPIGDEDFRAVVLNTEDVDTTEYTILLADDVDPDSVSFANSSGTPVTKAMMGTQIIATLYPAKDFMVHTFSVEDKMELPITVTASGENRYYFEMTNSDVTVKPTFVRKVMVAETENGTVVPTPLGAPTGTTVYLTVAANEGYELETLTLNESGDGLTQLTDTLYSFVMPDAAVKVSATFKEAELPEPEE